jgi:hypothetical protein
VGVSLIFNYAAWTDQKRTDKTDHPNGGTTSVSSDQRDVIGSPQVEPGVPSRWIANRLDKDVEFHLEAVEPRRPPRLLIPSSAGSLRTKVGVRRMADDLE